MNSHQNKFPILSFLLSKIDPVTYPPLQPHQEHDLLTQFPYLTNPEVQTSLTNSIPITTIQAYTTLMSMGPRPNPDAVSSAKPKLTHVVEPAEMEMYKAVVRLDELHDEYERKLVEEEERVLKVYKGVVKELGDGEVDEEVVNVLKESESGSVVERVDLSGRDLRLIPEAFGRINGLVLLNLSWNSLKILPDSIAGLEKLEELNVSNNLLESLPDSIGLLRNLKVLNISGNKLTNLPESIALCSSLVELDASFNNLMSLPTNIGYGLVNLARLSIPLNKIRFLPPSIGEMKSLRFLDVHFNELHGVPQAIGRLQSLEVLNLSSNFADLTALPETLGDLTNLRELDVSNNQIRVLPDSFGRLEKLTKLNLEGNPLEIPPLEIANKGVDAVREFMVKRWKDMMEEQQRSMLEANQQQDQSGWLAWSTSLLSNIVSGVSQTVTGYIGGAKTPRDPYLDQEL